VEQKLQWTVLTKKNPSIFHFDQRLTTASKLKWGTPYRNLQSHSFHLSPKILGDVKPRAHNKNYRRTRVPLVEPRPQDSHTSDRPALNGGKQSIKNKGFIPTKHLTGPASKNFHGQRKLEGAHFHPVKFGSQGGWTRGELLRGASKLFFLEKAK